MYYLWLNEQQVGPFSLEQLQGYLADGSAHASTLYWQEGMAEWSPLGTLADLAPAAPPPRRLIAGFWRRSAAWLVDALVLGLPIALLGIPLFGFFVSLGAFGPPLGFAIAIAYFGVLNSAVGKGQTLGKKALGIEVIDAQGAHLPVGRSLLRYVVLAVPYYVNCALPMLNLPAFSWSTILLGFVIFLWGGPVLYLYLCNRHTRQSVHDLAAGSYVVRQAPPGAVFATPIWRGHWIILGCLVVLCLGGVLTFRFIELPQSFAEMLKVQESIMATGEFRSASVTKGVNVFFGSSGTQRTNYYAVSAMTKSTQTNLTDAGKKIAGLLLVGDPAAAQSDIIGVTVGCGYNLGLASWSNSRGVRDSPANWQKALSGQPTIGASPP